MWNKISLTIWTLSGARAFLYSLIVTGSAFRGAVALKPWSAMNHDEAMGLIVALFITQAGVMLAFMDKTIATLETLAHPTAPNIVVPLAPPKAT
jgi:hypothetical protein